MAKLMINEKLLMMLAQSLDRFCFYLSTRS